MFSFFSFLILSLCDVDVYEAQLSSSFPVVAPALLCSPLLLRSIIVVIATPDLLLIESPPFVCLDAFYYRVVAIVVAVPELSCYYYCYCLSMLLVVLRFCGRSGDMDDAGFRL